MEHLNRQIALFSNRLISEVFLTAEESRKVGTYVSADIRFLPVEAKEEIKAVSKVPISARYDELVAFQAWSDFANSVKKSPAITRASVIVQNYVCFVYLKDACFEVISKRANPGSVASRCAAYLSSSKVRDFRNAFSHANWKYNEAFTGLECWVRVKPHEPESMRHFTVSQTDLNFWQALSRCVAYATYEQLKK